LVPRLDRFLALHPEIDLRISATMALVDFRKDEADLAIRFGKGPYFDVDAERLLPEALAPMCSPRLLNGKHPLKSPDDLRHFRLLHDMSIPGNDGRLNWAKWLSLAGTTKVSPNRGPRFTLAELALQTAIDGGGVVLGRLTLAADDIAAERLICPFDLVLPLEVSYFMVLPPRNRERAEIVAFQAWLRAEAQRSELIRRAATRRQ
jgi:LysR family glycine cleavage system transcriptional activator